MKCITILFIAILVAGCGNEQRPPVSNTNTRTADSTDSVKRVQEEEEVSEELIHGAFDALNR